MHRYLLLLLSTTVSLTYSFPPECFLPSIRAKSVKCVEQLSTMSEKMKKVKKQGVAGPTFNTDLNDFCVMSLDCSKTLQSCAAIDKMLIVNLEGVCDLHAFTNGKFKECYAKLESSRSNEKCVTDFLLNPVYTDAPNAKSRCLSLKNDGKCLEKRAETVCSTTAASDFEDHLDVQLKRFGC